MSQRYRSKDAYDGRTFWHMLHVDELENMLKEMLDTKGQILLWFHLHEVPRIVNFIETESRIVIPRGWGQLLFSGYIISIWDDENVREMGWRWVMVRVAQ